MGVAQARSRARWEGVVCTVLACARCKILRLEVEVSREEGDGRWERHQLRGGEREMQREGERKKRDLGLARLAFRSSVSING